LWLPDRLFLYLKSISFGKGIDEVLDKYKYKQNVITEYDTADLIGKSLKLLMNKRVDYMLSVDGTLNDAKKLGMADKIAFISIEEQDKYEIGYITAPKNMWGKETINKVNSILLNVILSDNFFKYFKPLVDDAMIPKLRQHYNESILAPAKEAP